MVHINDYQKQRFVERMIEAMFNTISGKKIAVLGFAFKKVRYLLNPQSGRQALHPACFLDGSWNTCGDCLQDVVTMQLICRVDKSA